MSSQEGQNDEKKFSEVVKEKTEQVKQHIERHRTIYLCGATGIVCMVGTRFAYRSGVEDLANQIIDKVPTTSVINNTVAPVINNTVNNGGHCTKIVQRLSDKEVFEQAGDAAFDIAGRFDVTYDRARWMLSRHLNGHLADVFGEKYKTIGLGTTG